MKLTSNHYQKLLNNIMNTLQQKIESLLFYKNEPVSYTWLSKTLGLSVSEIVDHVSTMSQYYDNRGMTLLRTESAISLVTSQVGSDIISEISKKDESKELSKQALETLAIIVYKGSVTKSEVDYIRGVNSVFILRNLLIRGLIQKQQNPADKRAPLYIITHDTLSFLGIHTVSELPGYTEYMKKLTDLSERYEHEQMSSETEL